MNEQQQHIHPPPSSPSHQQDTEHSNQKDDKYLFVNLPSTQHIAHAYDQHAHVQDVSTKGSNVDECINKQHDPQQHMHAQHTPSTIPNEDHQSTMQYNPHHSQPHEPQHLHATDINLANASNANVATTKVKSSKKNKSIKFRMENPSDPNYKSVTQKSNFKDITLEDMSSYFHLPQTQAAEMLGVSLSTLKRRFYSFGIGRWPSYENNPTPSGSGVPTSNIERMSPTPTPTPPLVNTFNVASGSQQGTLLNNPTSLQSSAASSNSSINYILSERGTPLMTSPPPPQSTLPPTTPIISSSSSPSVPSVSISSQTPPPPPPVQNAIFSTSPFGPISNIADGAGYHSHNQPTVDTNQHERVESPPIRVFNHEHHYERHSGDTSNIPVYSKSFEETDQNIVRQYEQEYKPHSNAPREVHIHHHHYHIYPQDYPQQDYPQQDYPQQEYSHPYSTPRRHSLSARTKTMISPPSPSHYNLPPFESQIPPTQPIPIANIGEYSSSRVSNEQFFLPPKYPHTVESRMESQKSPSESSELSAESLRHNTASSRFSHHYHPYHRQEQHRQRAIENINRHSQNHGSFIGSTPPMYHHSLPTQPPPPLPSSSSPYYHYQYASIPNNSQPLPPPPPQPQPQPQPPQGWEEKEPQRMIHSDPNLLPSNNHQGNYH